MCIVLNNFNYDLTYCHLSILAKAFSEVLYLVKKTAEILLKDSFKRFSYSQI